MGLAEGLLHAGHEAHNAMVPVFNESRTAMKQVSGYIAGALPLCVCA